MQINYTLVDGNPQAVSIATPLPVTIPGGSFSSVVTGSTDPLSAPVVIGGLVNTGLPASQATGTLINLLLGPRGSAATFLTSKDGSTTANVNAAGDALSGTSVSLFSVSLSHMYNPTTNQFFRQRGDGINAFAVAAPTSDVLATPTSTETAAAASGFLAKAGAGNLYAVECSNDTTAGYLMVFDSATLPANGVVTPKKIYVMAANSSLRVAFNPPIRMTNGIAVRYSTTGNYNLTALGTNIFVSCDYE